MPFTERLASRLAPGAVFFAALLATTLAARAETPIPDPPERWLTDQAGFLSPAAQKDVDQRLAGYARATGHQVLVYIDRTTGGVPIEDWAVKAFQRWRVGRKGIDDGLVLFIFSSDRRVRIEVGYGLEPIMIDAKASQIIRDVIVPRIRDGDRDGAVRLGVDAILNTLGNTGSTQPPVPAARPSRFSPADKRTLWIVALGFLAIPVLLLVLSGLVLLFPRLARSVRTRSTSGRERNQSDQDGPSASGSSSRSSGDSDGFSGGGGTSGGGGASGSW